MASAKLLDKLNEQLNREVSTFLRYMRQASAIRGAAWEAVREMYLREVTDEVQHAQYLCNQISALGGTPTLAPDLSEHPADVRAMLEADIAAERTDVANYTALADLAGEEGFIALKLQMEEQAADEDSHGMEMHRLLGG